MQQQRSSDTAPELILRRALHRRGLRYHLHKKIVSGTTRRVDIVFPGPKVAVDVRGCYWHGHRHEFAEYQRYRNLSYWTPKIARNKARDLDTAKRLRRQGWKVCIVWACQDMERAADTIEIAVRTRSAQ